MYILVVVYSSHERSCEEFLSLKDLKKHIETHSYVLENQYYIAKVLATEHTSIDDLKEEWKMKRNELRWIKDSLYKILIIVTWSIIVFAVLLALIVCYYSAFKEVAVPILILFLISQVAFYGYMMYSLGVIHDSM